MLNYFRKPSSKCFTPVCLLYNYILYILYQILNICLPDWETALTNCCIVCIFEKFTHSRNSNCLSSLSWRKAEGTKNVIYNTAEYLQLSSLSVSGLVLQQTCSSAEGTRDLWRGLVLHNMHNGISCHLNAVGNDLRLESESFSFHCFSHQKDENNQLLTVFGRPHPITFCFFVNLPPWAIMKATDSTFRWNWISSHWSPTLLLVVGGKWTKGIIEKLTKLIVLHTCQPVKVYLTLSVHSLHRCQYETIAPNCSTWNQRSKTQKRKTNLFSLVRMYSLVECFNYARLLWLSDLLFRQ